MVEILTAYLYPQKKIAGIILNDPVNVNPEYIILAEPDGVIVIPRKDAPQILEDTNSLKVLGC